MITYKKPKILIIYTGGTIGMIENPETHALQPFDFSHLMDNVPKVKKLDYDIDNIQFNPPIDSSNMDPSHWRDIALAIEEHYYRYDGFVVLHVYRVGTEFHAREPKQTRHHHRLATAHRRGAYRR